MRACSFASQDINCHTIPHATLATLSSPIQHIHLVAVSSAYQLFHLKALDLSIFPTKGSFLLPTLRQLHLKALA